MEHLFSIKLTEQTKMAAEAFIKQLDPQIDELQEQLRLLQGVRRAVAGTFGFDRRDGVGKIAQAADRAKRAEYEGDDAVDKDGRFVPNIVGQSRAETIAQMEAPMAGRLVPRPVEGDA